MPEYLSPGVYVEEYESGAVAMEGVSTSTAGFIGLAEKGPVVGRPVFLTNFSDYMRVFGSFLPESKYAMNRFMPNAVEHFFINGGARCFVMRVAPKDAKTATGKTTQVLSFEAKNPGEWGNRIKISITPASRQKTQVLEASENEATVKNSDGLYAGDVIMFDDGIKPVYNKVVAVQGKVITFENPVSPSIIDKNIIPKKFLRTCEMNISVMYEGQKEDYAFVTLNDLSVDYVCSRLDKSELINVIAEEVKIAPVVKSEPPKDKKNDKEGEIATPPPAPTPTPPVSGLLPPYELACGKGSAFNLALTEGNDGSISSISAADYIGSDIGPGKRTGIQSYIEVDNVNIMAVPGVTMPDVQLSLVAHCENTKSRFAILDMPKNKEKVDELLSYRDMFDTSYSAMYHPWIETLDPLSKRSAFMPPSGAMAGIYARTDINIGVHKAPANEVVRACTGLEYNYNSGEQDMLNPKGVNLIRSFPGRGVRVWGARTLSSNATWKYINVRRLFIFLEESIKANTNWVVFEPNSEVLWTRVKRSVEMFLTTVWGSGALAGTAPEQAFFVDIGRNTMTQDDLDNGRLICVIGVAPVKPAEFVIFRIGQYTADSNA